MPKPKAAEAASKPLPVERVVQLLKQVGDPTRLRILDAIAAGEKHVTDLCGLIGLQQPAVSHHLALLRVGELIEPRRAGKHNFYALTDRGRVLLDAVRAIGDA